MAQIKCHYSPVLSDDVDCYSISGPRNKYDNTCDNITEIHQEYATIFMFSEPQPSSSISHAYRKRLCTISTINQSNLFYQTALEPFHVSLRCFGMMYDTNTESRFNISKWYYRFVMVIMWFNFLRFFAAYNLGEPFGLMVTSKIIIHGMFFWSICGCVATKIMAKHRPIIFKAWLEYRDNFSLTADKHHRKQVQQRVLITLVTSWLILIIATAILYFVYDHNQMIFILRLTLLPFVDICNQQYHNVLYFCLILFINLFNMSTCGFQLGYMLLIVMGITDEFSQFNAQFEKCLNHSSQSSIDLEDWRKQHLELSKLTELVDAGFGLYILLLFLTNIGVCCFLVYMTIFTMAAQDTAPNVMAGMVAIFVFYLSLSVGIIFIITYAGTKLNTQVTYSIDSHLAIVCIKLII